MKNFKGLFSIVQTSNHFIYSIFGIKIRFRKKIDNVRLLEREILNLSLLKNEIKLYSRCSRLHYDVFHKYKNINSGKSIVICGSGPSLNKYTPIKNALHCSLNRAFENQNIKFDYLFACDWNGIKVCADAFKNYDGIKFLGSGMTNPIEKIPQDYINSFPCENFCINQYWTDNAGVVDLAEDLESQPLAIGNTVALVAMQFLLWTNPAKIYIAGCDCAPTGHFCKMTDEFEVIYQKSINNGCYELMLKEWKLIKDFAATYYPNTEIISVNPVGLKTLFKDIYL